MMEKFLQDLIPPQPYGMIFDPADTAEIMHEQTKWFRTTFQGQLVNIMRYLNNPVYITRGASGYNDLTQLPAIDLPEPIPLVISLTEALATRRSSYKLAGTITKLALSSLLHYAARVNNETQSMVVKDVKITKRPYPSPGGLYPMELYMYINRVEEISPCIAYYDPRMHNLRVISEHDGQGFVEVEIQSGEKPVSAPLILVQTLVPQRVTAKYGGRGYRMGLLEVGHAGQNFCLVAKGLGLDTLVYGSYFDNELASALEIDSVTETVASVILVGKEQE